MGSTNWTQREKKAKLGRGGNLVGRVRGRNTGCTLYHVHHELLNRNILEKLNLFVSWTIKFKIKIYTFSKYCAKFVNFIGTPRP